MLLTHGILTPVEARHSLQWGVFESLGPESMLGIADQLLYEKFITIRHLTMLKRRSSVEIGKIVHVELLILSDFIITRIDCKSISSIILHLAYSSRITFKTEKATKWSN